MFTLVTFLYSRVYYGNHFARHMSSPAVRPSSTGHLEARFYIRDREVIIVKPRNSGVMPSRGGQYMQVAHPQYHVGVTDQ